MSGAMHSGIKFLLAVVVLSIERAACVKLGKRGLQVYYARHAAM